MHIGVGKHSKQRAKCVGSHFIYEEALKVDSIDNIHIKKLWLTEVWEVHILFFQL